MSGAEVGGEPPVETDLQRYPGGTRRLDGAIGVGQRQRHRLLTEDGLAATRGSLDEVGVHGRRRGNDDRLYRGVRQQLCRFEGCLRAAQRRRQPFGDSRCRIRHRGDSSAGYPPGKALPVKRADAPRPDQADLYGR